MAGLTQYASQPANVAADRWRCSNHLQWTDTMSESLSSRLQLLRLSEARAILNISERELVSLVVLGRLRTFALDVDGAIVRCVRLDVEAIRNDRCSGRKT